jgi:hypothetical protein
MLQQREHIMTPAEIEGRRVVAHRLFYALRAHYPDKYVALSIQPRDVADDEPDDLTVPKTAGYSTPTGRRSPTSISRLGVDRRSAVHLTSSRATARRIAANIAELPELLKRLRPQGLVRPAGFERVGQPQR